MIIMALAHSCAPGDARVEAPGGTEPRVLVASPESRIGGQALLEGGLRIVRGCVIVSSGEREVLPIFDPSVRLEPSGRAILDAETGERVRVGGRLRGSAAYLRDNGIGWTDAEISRFTGASVPADCGDTVVRVSSITAIEAPK